MNELTLDMINKAISLMNEQKFERMVLIGSDAQISVWKTMYGDSVEYKTIEQHELDRNPRTVLQKCLGIKLK